MLVIETINQLNKIYLNQNRRITKYSRFQTLSLSLNVCWIKWRKVRVSLYVKVLHSPIIIFYWNFYSKELLNFYFTTAIKLYLDIFSGLFLAPQKILWRYHKRFWGTKLNLFLVLYFCRSHQLIIHYIFWTSSI